MSLVSESQLLGLIGSGITHSLTPALHEREADRLGLRYIYRPIDLDVIGRPAEDVGALLREGRDLGFTAFNITFPCKQIVIEHLDELSDAARRLGAVNTVLVREGRLVGDNTDVTGFAWGLANGLADAPLSRVVQLGSGGAGAAVAYALLEAGTQHLAVYDVDSAKAEQFAGSMQELFPGSEVAAVSAEELPTVLASADGLVNATPIGMHHHPGLPLDASLVHARLWVADVVYRPVETELLRLAAGRGCRILDGGHMAVGQAIATFALVTGVTPVSARMREHFLDMITRGL